MKTPLFHRIPSPLARARTLDNTHLRFLVTINLTTGIGITIGPILIDDLDSMAFVPARR